MPHFVVENYIPKQRSPSLSGYSPGSLGVPPAAQRPGSEMGRHAYENTPVFRAFLAQCVFRITSLEALRNGLLTDPNLRLICGFSTVPSLATLAAVLPCLPAVFGDSCLERHGNAVPRWPNRRPYLTRIRGYSGAGKASQHEARHRHPSHAQTKTGSPPEGEVRPPSNLGAVKGGKSRRSREGAQGIGYGMRLGL